MEVLSSKKYNEQQTKKWDKDYDVMMAKISAGERHLSELPQLAFYLFNPSRNYGYVAFEKQRALWNRTKKGVIKYWNDSERLRKERGW